MTKIISLTDEVYGKLRALKGNRSFSGEIGELIDKASTKGDVKSLRGLLGAWSRTEAAAFQKEISESRKNMKPRRIARY